MGGEGGAPAVAVGEVGVDEREEAGKKEGRGGWWGGCGLEDGDGGYIFEFDPAAGTEMSRIVC